MNLVIGWNLDIDSASFYVLVGGLRADLSTSLTSEFIVAAYDSTACLFPVQMALSLQGCIGCTERGVRRAKV